MDKPTRLIFKNANRYFNKKSVTGLETWIETCIRKIRDKYKK